MKKKLCLLAALTLSLSSLVGCSKIEARVEIRNANDAYAKEDYNVALEHYRKAREIDGTSFPDLDRMIGYSLIGLYVPEDKTPANVKNLELQWVSQVLSRGNNDKWEASPLVVDGVIYTVRPPNEVVALDAAAIWAYHPRPHIVQLLFCHRQPIQRNHRPR